VTRYGLTASTFAFALRIAPTKPATAITNNTALKTSTMA